MPESRLRAARRWPLIALVPLCAAIAQAAPTPPMALLALAKDDQTLAIIDPGSLRVVARVPAGPDPHEIAVSTDGRTAFVSNYAYGRHHTITVIDLVAQRRRATLDVRPLDGPHGLAIAGDRLWFTSEIAKALGRLDPASGRIDQVVGTGQDRTHMVWVSKDGHRLVASNVSSGTLSIFDRAPPQTLDGPPSPNSAAGGNGGEIPPWTPPHEGWRTAVLPTGAGAEGFAVAPDERTLWIANASDGSISIVDLTTLVVTRTFKSGLALANRVVFTPDGARVLVSQFFGPELAVFDAARGELLRRIPAGRGSAGIAVQPDGRRAYVSLWRDNAIEVIDLATLTTVGRVAAGNQPDGLAIAVRRGH